MAAWTQPRAVADDLDDYLDSDLPLDAVGDTDVEPPGNIAEAELWLGRYRRNVRDRAQVESLARERIGQIERWRDERLAVIDNEQSWIGGLLERFARAVNGRTGAKSWALPSGKLTLRKPRGRIVVDDEDAASNAMLTAHDDWVRTEYRVVKDKVRAETTIGPVIQVTSEGENVHALVDLDGVVVDDVVFVVAAADTFSISAPNPEGD